MLGFEFELASENCLGIFVGQSSLSNTEFASLIKNIYDKNLRPNRIVFLFPKFLYPSINEQIDSCNTDIVRYGKNVPVLFLSFDVQGLLSREKTIHDDFKTLDLNEFQKQFIMNGCNFLIKGREADIITKAPSGTIFIKPSGSTLEEFIYASQLSRNYYESQFLAFCLLTIAPDLSKILWIYIDTASISGIVESIIYYVHKFTNSICKNIKYKSFSSYSGLNSNTPNEPELVWVIISASSSKNLGKKIIEEWSVPPSNVVTILSYDEADTSSSRGNYVLHSINHISKRQKNLNAPIRVQVKGESFVAEIATPKKVLIKEAHKPDTVNKNIAIFAKSNVFTCNTKAGSAGGGNVRAKRVFFNYKNFIKHDEFKEQFEKWISRLVKWEIPKNLGAIITMPGSDHTKFRERME